MLIAIAIADPAFTVPSACAHALTVNVVVPPVDRKVQPATDRLTGSGQATVAAPAVPATANNSEKRMDLTAFSLAIPVGHQAVDNRRCVKRKRPP